MTAPSSRAMDARHFALTFVLPLVALMASVAPARADFESFAWPGWHTPPEQVRFVDSRLNGTYLEAWMNGFGPPPVDDPLALVRTPPVVTSVGPSGWSPVPPPARWAHSMVYDSIRDRLLVFGGQGYSGWSNEVWALNLGGIPQWTLVATGGTAPGPRGFHSAVFDSLGDRMLVFGGTDGTSKNELWQLSFAGLATWTKLTPGGTTPAPRQYHTAILDRARNRMVIYGGNAGGAPMNDAWALNLSGAPTWTAIMATGSAPPRASHAAVYDAVGDRMIVLCGIDTAGDAKNDTYALSFAGTPAWSALAPTGVAPSPRLGASALYDRVRRRVIVFAGGTGAPNSNETFTLSLIGAPAWASVPTQGMPQGRQFHTAILDPIGDRLMIFGGSSGPVLSDTWSLPLTTSNPTWRPFSGTRRKGHTAVLDISRNRMLVFGGENSTQLNDVWELALGEPPQWTRLNPDGDPPSPRALHGAIYDGKRDRMIVFGGRGTTPVNDVWELSFSGELAWRSVVAVGSPPAPRLDPVVVYDSMRRRMIVFGGASANGVYNDVYALTLSGTPTWTQISTSGAAPSARGASQAIYDPVRDRLIIHGGYDRNFFALSDVWALNLSGTPGWTSLSPSGASPAARFAAATAYDRTRDRMVFSSGTNFADFFLDTWSLNLSPSTSWSSIVQPGVQPTARSDHKAVYDENLDRFVLFGGINPLGILHDSWELDFTAVVAAPVVPLATDVRVAFSSAVPNPTSGASTISFALGAPGATRVSIHDALGRRVRSLDLGGGTLPAGPHHVVWDGKDDGGRAAPAGLYFVRVVTEGAAAAGKIVRVN